MGKHPEAFGPLYRATVAAAEKVSALDSAFRELAALILWERDLRKRILAAIRYPCLVIAAMACGLVVVQQVVVPQFARVFSQMGADLPLVTRCLVGLSGFVGSWWWAMLGVAAGGFLLLRRSLGAPASRLRIDRAVLRVPFLGSVLRHLYLARFARTLGLLYARGLPIIDALRVIQGTIGNRQIAGEVGSVEAAVSSGQSLAEAALGQPSFSPLVRNMLRVGETTGQIDEAMAVISEFHDEEATQALQEFLAWIEPALTVLLGVFVLFLALAIFLPWWDLTGLYRK